MKAVLSALAFAAAALRSSSVLPIFFWFLSLAACAFCTFDPFPIFLVAVAGTSKLNRYLPPSDDGAPLAQIKQQRELLCSRNDIITTTVARHGMIGSEGKLITSVMTFSGIAVGLLSARAAPRQKSQKPHNDGKAAVDLKAFLIAVITHLASPSYRKLDET